MAARIALLFLVCLFSSSSIEAQYFDFYEVVDSIKPELRNVYPHFTSKKVPAVADSINHAIINQVPGILPDSDFSGTYSDMGFDVSRNDDGVLAILVSYDACAAYCERYNEYYTFDSKTGKPIEPEDIFMPGAETLIMDSLNRMKNARINTFLRDSFQLYIAGDSNLIGDSATIYRLYSDCRADAADIGGIDPKRLEIGENTFAITIERCFPHVLRAVDILWEYRFEFVAKDWRKYMTPYGRKIFKL